MSQAPSRRLEALPQKLLWVDCLAGALVGALLLLLRGWLSELYRLPQELLFFMGMANLTYAAYSLSLAVRRTRPRPLILLLVFANMMWAVACLWWVSVFVGTASFFGLAQLAGEALFVGGLAVLEWRWRDLLQNARGSTIR